MTDFQFTDGELLAQTRGLLSDANDRIAELESQVRDLELQADVDGTYVTEYVRFAEALGPIDDTAEARVQELLAAEKERDALQARVAALEAEAEAWKLIKWGFEGCALEHLPNIQYFHDGSRPYMPGGWYLVERPEDPEDDVVLTELGKQMKGHDIIPLSPGMLTPAMLDALRSAKAASGEG